MTTIEHIDSVMKDMLGASINPGDFFIIPGGNVRYGGLVLEVGIVLSMTEKRLKTLITRFDKIKAKPTNKTSKKVLKVSPNEPFMNQPAVIHLQGLYKEYNQEL
jgi:hypothetical protein